MIFKLLYKIVSMLLLLIGLAVMVSLVAAFVSYWWFISLKP